ncbi:MAG TPA: PEP-CTERM sorting domain-containing protein [Casimicrobiaceae bacterium]|nr:PEP-CTERM sorting domain-containing protein [Casimicrobiaceae bacterium]
MKPFARFIAGTLALLSLPTFALADTTALPEPETLWLLAIGVIALVLGRRRK